MGPVDRLTATEWAGSGLGDLQNLPATDWAGLGQGPAAAIAATAASEAAPAVGAGSAGGASYGRSWPQHEYARVHEGAGRSLIGAASPRSPGGQTWAVALGGAAVGPRWENGCPSAAACSDPHHHATPRQVALLGHPQRSVPP